MLGLAENTSFYHQSEGYLTQDDAAVFIQQFTEQIVLRSNVVIISQKIFIK
jgi:hypothetical protein